MTPSEYQEMAEKTENQDFPAIASRCRWKVALRLMHASLGLITETGEFTDTLKKHLFYGKDLDRVNLEEELGDILWYVAEACNAMHISMESVMTKNIEKLQARYPERFREYDALHRNLEQERDILEGKDG